MHVRQRPRQAYNHIVNRTRFKVIGGYKENDSKAICLVSAENGDDAADYYGEFRGGYAWINPTLEGIARTYGCHWEWVNPGCIGLYT